MASHLCALEENRIHFQQDWTAIKVAFEDFLGMIGNAFVSVELIIIGIGQVQPGETQLLERFWLG